MSFILCFSPNGTFSLHHYGNKDMFFRFMGDSELAVGVNVSLNDFLSLCVSPVINWWPVEDVLTQKWLKLKLFWFLPPLFFKDSGFKISSKNLPFPTFAANWRDSRRTLSLRNQSISSSLQCFLIYTGIWVSMRQCWCFALPLCMCTVCVHEALLCTQ